MNVEQRLAMLERESRNWRRIAIGLTVAIGALLSYQAMLTPRWLSTSTAMADDTQNVKVQEIIRAKRIEIVNDQGKNAASFYAPNGSGTLVLHSADMNASVILTTDSQPGIAPHASCSVRGDAGEVDVSPDGITVYPADAKQRRLAENSVKGVPMTAKERQQAFAIIPAVHIGFSDLHGGAVDVFNPLGKIVASIQADKTNAGLNSVSNVNGEHSHLLSPTP